MSTAGCLLGSTANSMASVRAMENAPGHPDDHARYAAQLVCGGREAGVNQAG
jgi:predicted benzoate:H+ symporter BenE